MGLPSAAAAPARCRWRPALEPHRRLAEGAVHQQRALRAVEGDVRPRAVDQLGAGPALHAGTGRQPGIEVSSLPVTLLRAQVVEAKALHHAATIDGEGPVGATRVAAGAAGGVYSQRSRFSSSRTSDTSARPSVAHVEAAPAALADRHRRVRMRSLLQRHAVEHVGRQLGRRHRRALGQRRAPSGAAAAFHASPGRRTALLRGQQAGGSSRTSGRYGRQAAIEQSPWPTMGSG